MKKTFFLTFVLYHTPAVIWFPPEENSTVSSFLRDTSNRFPQHRSPLLQILPICTQKWQVVNTFSELDKNQMFSTKSFLLLHSDGYWGCQPVQRDALGMKHHFKNAFAAVHISLQSLNCELYLSKPMKKRGGLSGGCEGGEKRKEFLPNKRAPRNWYNFAGSYFQPTQHFFLYTDIPESQQGAFFPAEIRTISKSDHHQREIRQPSGCKANNLKQWKNLRAV